MYQIPLQPSPLRNVPRHSFPLVAVQICQSDDKKTQRGSNRPVQPRVCCHVANVGRIHAKEACDKRSAGYDEVIIIPYKDTDTPRRTHSGKKKRVTKVNTRIALLCPSSSSSILSITVWRKSANPCLISSTSSISQILSALSRLSNAFPVETSPVFRCL